MKKMKFDDSLKIILVVSTIINLSVLFYILSLYDNVNLGGLYFKDKEIIMIEIENKSVPYIQRVFYHELGHHIWYTFLNETEREHYAFLINEINEKEIKEDFATWFSIYLYGQSGEEERNIFFKEKIEKYNLDLYERIRR